MTATRAGVRIAAFPRGTSAYTDCFNDALAARGADVIDGVYSGRWLLANASRFDALHSHWPSFFYFKEGDAFGNWRRLAKLAMFLIYLRLRGKHVFWTAHNLYPHDGGSELALHRAGRRLMRRMATRVFAHGPAAAEILTRRLAIPARKLRLIEHGHWIGYYANDCTRAAARNALGLPAAARVFLFVGICKPYKNLEPLVDAFQKLADGSVLVIAGKFQSGAYRERIERLIARQPQNIHLHGRYIKDEELQLFLNAADAVVLPYSEILTSGAAMLALTFGRPVIAPSLGCLVEIITPACGTLYNPGDDAGLERTLSAFDPARFSEQAILESARRFSWDRSAQTVIGSCLE